MSLATLSFPFADFSFDRVRFVAQYTGDNMDVRIAPELIDGICEYVELWHDESSFHANDHQSAYWLKTGQQVLKKKERGRVIMVSDFLVEETGVQAYRRAGPRGAAETGGGATPRVRSKDHLSLVTSRSGSMVEHGPND